MLVELERNELGRVCHWGSVRVTELLAVERYSHVLHLVSNIAGELTATAPAELGPSGSSLAPGNEAAFFFS